MKLIDILRCFFLVALLGFSNCVLALPSMINPPGEKAIVFDPNEHAWGAYSPDGRLIRSGVASGGKDWCPDTGQPCRSSVGSWRIRSLGGGGCKSPSFPLPRGGAPMPYCMYYSHTQALHGSPRVVRGNISHGCVRLYPRDAKWIRYNFAEIGTLVIINPYY